MLVPVAALGAGIESPLHQRAEYAIAPAANHPAAYIGWAPHRKIGECISPSQEKPEATVHQIAARPKFRSIISVIKEATTRTRNRKPLPSPWIDPQYIERFKAACTSGTAAESFTESRAEFTTAETTAPVGRTNPSRTALRYFGSTRRSVAVPTPIDT